MIAEIKSMISKLIRDKRAELNMTQDELAKATGVTARHIQNLENGRVSDAIAKSFSLWRYLGLINESDDSNDDQAD